MSLVVTVDDPRAPRDASDRHFMKPAGFESYRQQLWGTPAVAARAPMLSQIETDLHVVPAQFQAFEAQCRAVQAEADAIGSELGWSEQESASIRGYVHNFLEALEFARAHGSERISIW